MNKILSVKPVSLTPKLLTLLEKKGLIRTLKPSKNILATKPKSGRMEIIYASHPKYAGHKLAVIGLDNDKIKLNYHPDNEEFIFIKTPAYKCKDICIVIGMDKYKKFEQKAKAGKLKDKDVMVIKWPYNRPESCIFTMLKDTVHCEYVKPGPGKPPYFYVTEPAKFKMDFVKMNGYKIAVNGE